MIAEHHQQDAVVPVIVAFLRDAERLAALTATFLRHSGLGDDRTVWPGGFLLELGAVLRIRQWEIAGIKDAVDATLPTFDDAIVELARRLQTAPEQFIRGESPLLRRVLVAWWCACAHPTQEFVGVDVAVSPIDCGHLLSCIAQLLWNLRDIEID